MAVEDVVDEGDEGRALAAYGDVGGAKIGDGGDAGASGDDGRFPDLESGSGGKAEEGNGTALVEDGLAVAADQGDARWREFKLAEGGQSGFGEDVTEAEIKLRDLGGSGRGAFGDAKDFGPDCGGKRTRCVGLEFGESLGLRRQGLPRWRRRRYRTSGQGGEGVCWACELIFSIDGERKGKGKEGR